MKISYSLILCMFTIFFFHVDASGAGPKKIGVVDIQSFQNNSKTFQKTRAELKKKFDAMQQKLDAEKKALLKLEEDLNKQSMMLSLDAKEDKKRALDKKRRYYQYLYKDFAQEMKNLEMEATKKIGKELEKVVQKIGESEGYMLILEKRTLGLIFYDDSLDLTERVTKAYDSLK